MKDSSKVKLTLCGIAAGAVNGFLGTGGGMLLVPLLVRFTSLEENQIFPASVSIILPICVTSLLVQSQELLATWTTALPFLVGGIAGGIIAGITGRRIPVKWLHRGLGILILWCGIRKLW